MKKVEKKKYEMKCDWFSEQFEFMLTKRMLLDIKNMLPVHEITSHIIN